MSIKIEQWKKQRNEKAFSHRKLCEKLKKTKGKKLNDIADQLHLKVFEQVDCLDCANCCKSIPPILNETDIRRIAKHIGIKTTDFKNIYIKVDEDADMVFNNSPCSFLEPDNKCTIYENRPKACREYPHTGNFDFIKNLKLHPINSKYCPAVFHILEEFMQIVK